MSQHSERPKARKIALCIRREGENLGKTIQKDREETGKIDINLVVTFIHVGSILLRNLLAKAKDQEENLVSVMCTEFQWEYVGVRE